MKMEEISRNTGVLKLAAEAYALTGGSPATLLKEAAEWLLDCYRKTGDENCLEAAGEIVKAYMEMGIWDRDESVFDEVMEGLGTTIEAQFPKLLYPQNRIKLTASQVREVLGYWPNSKSDGDDVDWVVRDIIDRVKRREPGRILYKRGPSRVVFELLILESTAYLFDLDKKKVFFLEVQRGN